MRKLLLLLLFVVPSMCMAQDVIVKKDGTTILSKVLEVNPADIKYKKYSNQNGPTYTITKAEVMSINYESGDKDVFTDSQPAPQQEPTNGGFEVNPNLEADNLKLVQQFNQREPVYTGKPDKSANDFLGVLGLKEGSILETPELKVEFSMKRLITRYGGNEDSKIIDVAEKSNFGLNRVHFEAMVLVVMLTNKTNRSIFVDQANSFILHNKLGAKPFYIPTASTTGQASTSGGGIGLGILGGVVGINSSSTEMSSTTTYSQRIIAIPPMATWSLDPQNIAESYSQEGGIQKIYESQVIKCYIPFFLQQELAKERDKYYSIDFSKLKMGESLDIPTQEDTPFSVHITYSFDEQQKTTQSMRQDFYIRKLVGADDTGSGDRIDFEGFDLSQKPLLYLIRGKKLKK